MITAAIMSIAFYMPAPVSLDSIEHIESRGNPNARSPVGALGAYQFMPRTWAAVTKRMYKHPVPFRLARNPVIARAVAEYYLFVILPQELQSKRVPVSVDTVVAAYNCGSGNVAKAWRRGGSDGWKRYLPRETQNYIVHYHKESK